MAASDPLCLNQQIPNNPKKRKNDSRYEEEIEFSNNWLYTTKQIITFCYRKTLRYN